MLIHFFFLISYVRTQCLEIVTELAILSIINHKALVKEVSPYYYLSGKNINDYGQYNQCINKFNYAIFQIYAPKIPFSINLGVCLAEQCSLDTLNNSIQTFEKYIGNTISKVLKVQVPEIKIIMRSSNETHEQSAILYPFLGTFTLFLCLQVIVTLLQNRKKENQLLNIQSLNKEVESTYLDEEDKINQQQLESNSLIDRLNFNISENYQECWKLRENNAFEIMNNIRIFGYMFGSICFTGLTLMLQSNYLQCLHYFYHIFLQLAFCSFYSIDIFLWLSGFFRVISYNQSNNMFIKFVNRLWIFWICQLIMILINISIVPLIGNGPRWFYMYDFTQTDVWWQNLLFINNFYDINNGCTFWLWYLSLDIQLSLLCLCIMYIYKYNNNMGILITINLLIFSLAYNIYLAIHNDYNVPFWALFTLQDFFQVMFFRPHIRGPAYLVGMLVAFSYLHFKFKFHQILQYAFWLIGYTLIIYLCVGTYDTQQHGPEYYPELYRQLYAGCSRFAFSLGLTMIALPSLFSEKSFRNPTLFRMLSTMANPSFYTYYFILEVSVCYFYQSLEFNVCNAIVLYTYAMFANLIPGFYFKCFIQLPLSKLRVNPIKDHEIRQKLIEKIE